MESVHYATSNIRLPKFKEFWTVIADDLGEAKLRIRENAASIDTMIADDADTPAYLKIAIKDSYQLSKCHNINSRISLEAVFDLLGSIAYSLQGKKADDLLDIELLEEIAWIMCNRYSSELSVLTDGFTDEGSKTNKSQVLSFPKYKLKKANSLV